MNDMKVTQLFMRATANAICCKTDCKHCHKIYGTDICPADIAVKDGEFVEFVSKVVKLLRQWDEDMPFAAEITDGELVSLLKDAVTVEE